MLHIYAYYVRCLLRLMHIYKLEVEKKNDQKTFIKDKKKVSE